MNRRRFISLMFSSFTALGTYSIAPPILFDQWRTLIKVPRIRIIGRDETFDPYELFGAYSTRVGADLVKQLDKAGESTRREFNEGMATDGYQDAGDLRPHLSTMVREEVESYILGFQRKGQMDPDTKDGIEGIDTCVPFFTDYYAGKRRPLFETPAVVGLAVATADFKYQNPGVSDREVAQLFQPTGIKSKADGGLNAGVQGYVNGKWRTKSVHETENGALEVTYSPPRSLGTKTGRVRVTASGRRGVNFSESYPFEVV